MIVEDIPAGEQLMDTSAIGSVPPPLKSYLDGLEWPAAGAPSIPRTPINQELRADSIHWIQQALKPAWIPSDLDQRLRGARAVVSNKDAFLVRYSIGGTKLQIVVTKYHVHILIDPPAGAAAGNALATLHKYLAVDDKAPWSGEPWKLGQLGSLTFGYQPRTNFSDWRDAISYVTNGRVVKFSFQKAATLPPGSGPPKTVTVPSDEAERRWFDQKP
jgi:hypothetical protein